MRMGLGLCLVTLSLLTAESGIAKVKVGVTQPICPHTYRIKLDDPSEGRLILEVFMPGLGILRSERHSTFQAVVRFYPNHGDWADGNGTARFRHFSKNGASGWYSIRLANGLVEQGSFRAKTANKGPVNCQ